MIFFPAVLYSFLGLGLDVAIASESVRDQSLIARGYIVKSKVAPDRAEFLELVRRELARDRQRRPWLIRYHFALDRDRLRWLEGEGPVASYNDRRKFLDRWGQETSMLEYGWCARVQWWAGRLTVQSSSGPGDLRGDLNEGEVLAPEWPFVKVDAMLTYFGQSDDSTVNLMFVTAPKHSSFVGMEALLAVRDFVERRIGMRVGRLQVASSNWPEGSGAPIGYPFFAASLPSIDPPKYLRCQFTGREKFRCSGLMFEE